MSQLVQIVLPTGGRFQFSFSDTTTDEQILKSLDQMKVTFGYNGTVRKMDTDAPISLTTDFSDPASGFVLDNPKTVVVVYKTDPYGNVLFDDDKKTVMTEVRRLKGPAKE